MTDVETIRSMVSESNPAEWVPFPDMGTWTYRDEVELRIHRYEQLDSNFQTPWTQHLQANSQSFGYVIYYGDSPVEYHEIASVDNFRAHIPLPRPPNGPNDVYSITPYQETIGKIITGDEQTFEAYLNNTGIQVQR